LSSEGKKSKTTAVIVNGNLQVAIVADTLRGYLSGLGSWKYINCS